MKKTVKKVVRYMCVFSLTWHNFWLTQNWLPKWCCVHSIILVHVHRRFVQIILTKDNLEEFLPFRSITIWERALTMHYSHIAFTHQGTDKTLSIRLYQFIVFWLLSKSKPIGSMLHDHKEDKHWIVQSICCFGIQIESEFSWITYFHL